MSNSLDPDQAGRFVGPDLGPNYFKVVFYQMTLACEMLILPNIVLNIFSEFVELHLSAREILNLSTSLLS